MIIRSLLSTLIGFVLLACSAQNEPSQSDANSVCSIYEQVLTHIDHEISDPEYSMPIIFMAAAANSPAMGFPSWDAWNFTDEAPDHDDDLLDYRPFSALNPAGVIPCDFSEHTNWQPIISDTEVAGWIRPPSERQSMSSVLVGEILPSQIYWDGGSWAILAIDIDRHYFQADIWDDYIDGARCHLFQKHERGGWQLIATAWC